MILIAGALALPFARPGPRSGILVALPAAALALVWLVPDCASGHWRLFELEMVAVNSDALARLFATVFAIMALPNSNRTVFSVLMLLLVTLAFGVWGS